MRCQHSKICMCRRDWGRAISSASARATQQINEEERSAPQRITTRNFDAVGLLQEACHRPGAEAGSGARTWRRRLQVAGISASPRNATSEKMDALPLIRFGLGGTTPFALRESPMRRVALGYVVEDVASEAATMLSSRSKARVVRLSSVFSRASASSCCCWCAISDWSRFWAADRSARRRRSESGEGTHDVHFGELPHAALRVELLHGACGRVVLGRPTRPLFTALRLASMLELGTRSMSALGLVGTRGSAKCHVRPPSFA